MVAAIIAPGIVYTKVQFHSFSLVNWPLHWTTSPYEFRDFRSYSEFGVNFYKEETNWKETEETKGQSLSFR